MDETTAGLAMLAGQLAYQNKQLQEELIKCRAQLRDMEDDPENEVDPN